MAPNEFPCGGGAERATPAVVQPAAPVRRRLPTLSSVANIVAALWLSGCYSYTLVPARDAAVGQSVRVRVSGAQAERLEPVLGNTGREVEGELLDQQDSNVVISVTMPLSTAGGGVVDRARQRIVIPRSELQELHVRRLDRGRTSLAVAAAVAVTATAVAASTGAIRLGSSGSRGNPNREQIPLPLLRIPFGHRSTRSPP